MRTCLERRWYEARPPMAVLRPLACAYGAVADARARRQRDAAESLPVPVVVVGNVAVGGTGKTPCVIWMVGELRKLGREPGVLSRGYGGRGPFPCLVDRDMRAVRCGDEAALIARRCGVPVACAPDRVLAGRALLAAHRDVDVLVCDDGLQHYRLRRDLELCVVDGARGFGNGWRLPAGPLREPASRAHECAVQLVNGADAAPYGPHALRFDLRGECAQNLDSAERRSLESFADAPVCAVAGIGHPERFFTALRQAGLRPRVRAFADHHRYRARDFAFAGDAPVLMTEKDAVKCEGLAPGKLWMVPVDARFAPAAAARVVELLDRLPRPRAR
ncbi:MAG TPA: tetraacyldisaccharide 4'-kinase [Nevskiaceae bacterium]